MNALVTVQYEWQVDRSRVLAVTLIDRLLNEEDGWACDLDKLQLSSVSVHDWRREAAICG